MGISRGATMRAVRLCPCSDCATLKGHSLPAVGLLIDISFHLFLKEAFILTFCGAFFKSRTKNKKKNDIQKKKRENISTAPRALFAIGESIIFEVSFKV
jgi:hypothetical protein